MRASTCQTKPGGSTVKYCSAVTGIQGLSGATRISPRCWRRTVLARGRPTAPDTSSQRRTGGGSPSRSRASTTRPSVAWAAASSARASSSTRRLNCRVAAATTATTSATAASRPITTLMPDLTVQSMRPCTRLTFGGQRLSDRAELARGRDGRAVPPRHDACNESSSMRAAPPPVGLASPLTDP